MLSEFQSELSFKISEEKENVYVLTSPLIYYSKRLRRTVEIATGFETDLASVPRIPLVYSLWGGKAHREGVLHDYLYRDDLLFECTFSQANKVFLEAMKSREKPARVAYPMYWGVCVGGYPSYHKRSILSKF